uniref:Large ribosomal subunit protein uL24c n=1 Tax=Alexandrium monilatum TaxID=311494 RepID=A0A7S4V510_9DINO
MAGPRGPGAAAARGPVLLALALGAARLAARNAPRQGALPEQRNSPAFVPASGLAQGLAASAPRAPTPPRAAAAATAAPARGAAAVAAAGAAALAALAGRVRTPTPSRQSPRVLLRANSPFPSVPVGSRGQRRIRAGPHRPIFRGRQIRVRVNPNTNKPIRYRMYVRPGDTVQVMKGKDKGKVTTVLKTYPKWNRILCLGVNYCIKHVRPTREDEVGQRVQVEAPMHASVVMHYSEKEGVAGRLGIRFEEVDGEIVKIRYNKATGETIEDQEAPEWVPVLDRVSSDE